MSKYIGLEPANCTPDGRDVMRDKGLLKFLEPNESSTAKLQFDFTDSKITFDNAF